VVVAMAAVGGVEHPVDDVVDVIAVRDHRMTAALAVAMEDVVSDGRPAGDRVRVADRDAPRRRRARRGVARASHGLD